MKCNVIRKDGIMLEGMTKEQIENLLASEGVSEDLITSLVEINRRNPCKLWIGDKNEYPDAESVANGIYLVKDDAYYQSLFDEIESWNDLLNKFTGEQVPALVETIDNELVQFRDENYKDPECLASLDAFIDLFPIPSNKSRTFSWSGSYKGSWNGMDNHRIVTYIYVRGLTRFANFHLTVTFEASSFVSGQVTNEFDVVGTENGQQMILRMDDVILNGGATGSGHYRLDYQYSISMTGQF